MPNLPTGGYFHKTSKEIQKMRANKQKENTTNEQINKDLDNMKCTNFYSCKQCDKTYSSSSSLYRHAAIHKEKKNSCKKLMWKKQSLNNRQSYFT